MDTSGEGRVGLGTRDKREVSLIFCLNKFHLFKFFPINIVFIIKIYFKNENVGYSGEYGV